MSPAARRFILENRVFRPSMLANNALYLDASDVSSMRTALGAIPASGEAVALWSDKSGNSAVNCLVLNGVAGNYASTPDSVAVSPTTEVEFLADVTLATYVPGTQYMFFAKDNGGSQRSFRLSINSLGNIVLELSLDGSTFGSTATSSAIVGSSAFQRTQIKATWRNSDGRVQFFTATDGVSFSQLGTNITATTTALFDATSVLEIGSRATGTGILMVGLVHRAALSKTIGGAYTFDFDPSVAAKLAGTVTERSANAATVTINSTGATGARISGARDAYQGTAANMPIYLPWSGTNYGYLNGVAGHYFSTPDSAALDITGSIDIIVRAAATDWTPATVQELVTKYLATGDQRSYEIGINGATGIIRFVYTTLGTGASAISVLSTVAPTVADRATIWIRVTRNSATGDVTFYTAADQEAVPSSWTQLGDVVSTAAGAMFSGTAALELGSNGIGTAELFAGNILRAQIYNGIAGTLVFDFNPSAYVSGTTFLDAAGGATITLNGGSTIVTRSCLYFDGSNDYLKCPAFALSGNLSAYLAMSQASWTANDYVFDGEALNSFIMRQASAGATPQLEAYNGTTLSGVNGGLALQTNGIVSVIASAASSIALRVNRNAAVSAASAGNAFPNGFTLGTRGGAASGFANITASAVLVRANNDDTSLQFRLINFFMRFWRIP